MGKEFDPSKPEEYVASFAIKRATLTCGDCWMRARLALASSHHFAALFVGLIVVWHIGTTQRGPSAQNGPGICKAHG